MTVSRFPETSIASGTRSFSGMVGHELNNIAVPLEGYAELAGSAAGSEAAESLEEMRTAIARIKALASDLESLAEPGSSPTPVPIGDCWADEPGPRSAELPSIDWRCSAATVVAVDRPHARRAIRSLEVLAARTRSTTTPRWEVLLGPPAPARCACCGVALRRKDDWVLVQAYSARPVTTDALREPFGPARAGRLDRRLTLAVMGSSAHCAGGHVLLDDGSTLVTLAFRLA